MGRGRRKPPGQKGTGTTDKGGMAAGFAAGTRRLVSSVCRDFITSTDFCRGENSRGRTRHSNEHRSEMPYLLGGRGAQTIMGEWAGGLKVGHIGSWPGPVKDGKK